jgi:hypothetical protein
MSHFKRRGRAPSLDPLPQVKTPNRDNWIMPYPDRI